MQRRKFFKSLGLLSLGGILGAFITKKLVPKKKKDKPSFQSMSVTKKPIPIKNKGKIKFGIIGLGIRGGDLAKTTRNIGTIVAICDIMDFRLKIAKEKFGDKIKYYKRYQELLANKEVEAVIIATPLSTHGTIALAALDADKHVLCEKTMTFSIEESLALVKKVKETKKIFQVGHQYRLDPLWKQARDILRNKYLGDLNGFHIYWDRAFDWRYGDRVVKHLTPEQKKDKKILRLLNWRLYKEYSKGLLAELSSHQIDFLYWALGEEAYIEKYFGMGENTKFKDGRENYDNISLSVKCKNGLKGYIRSLCSNSYTGFRMLFFGTKYTMEISWNSHRLSILPRKRKSRLIIYPEPNKKIYGVVDGVSGATLKNFYKKPTIYTASARSNLNKVQMIHFNNNIYNNTEPECGVDQGARVAMTISNGFEAIDEEKIVTAKINV